MDSGKKAEKFILNYLDKLNKDTYVARFVDTYDANKGRWGSKDLVAIEERPCDAVLIYGGKTYFCEVKSTTNLSGLTSALFNKRGQKKSRIRVTYAGGSYIYLIYSYAKQQWYWVPYTDLKETANWYELEPFKVDFPRVPE